MDIKERIESVVSKLKSDDKLMDKFKDDPIKTIESIIGVDLPDGALDKVVDGVKAKLAGGNIADKLGDAVDGIKGIFGK